MSQSQSDDSDRMSLSFRQFLYSVRSHPFWSYRLQNRENPEALADKKQSEDGCPSPLNR